MADSGHRGGDLGSPPPLSGLAGRQHGVVAIGQLSELGFSRHVVDRLVRDGHLIRLHRGVYAVGHDRLTVRGRWMAAVLACGDGAVLSHRAALALWELIPAPGGEIDVSAAGRSRRRVAGVRFHGLRHLHPDDHTLIDGIPVTSLPRALLDHAPALHPQRLRTLLEQAQHRGLFNLLAFEALLTRTTGHHGTGALRAALAQLRDEAPWTQSELERRFLEFVRDHDLPEPQTNVTVDGVCVDCYWPAQNLIAELDSYAFHTNRRSFETDRRRQITHTRAGRHTIHITQHMITRQARTLRTDLAALLLVGTTDPNPAGR